MTNAPHGAGGYDWLARWTQMHDAALAQSAALNPEEAAEQGDRWARQASRFAASVQRASQPDAFLRFLMPYLRPSDTVMDIGAGSGRHALAMREMVMQVIAVEPSASMRAQLERRLAESSDSRIVVISARWPEAVVPACDVAIASHVIYGVREIGPFLQRMDATTHRACFLLAGFRQPSAWIAPFWERVYNEAKLPRPAALECFNALHQLGIPAQLSLIPSNPYHFATDEEALEDIRWRLHLSHSPEHTALLRTTIDKLLQRDATGQLIAMHQPSVSAVIWWEHN